MKPILVKVIVFFLMLGAAATFARSQSNKTPDERETVKKDLLELFELSKSERYAEIASFIVYRGTDEKRRWLEVYDFNNPGERREVEEVGAEIKRLIWLSDSYEFSEYLEKDQSKRRAYIWRLVFKSGANQATITFASFKIKERYAIADIDGHTKYLREISPVLSFAQKQKLAANEHELIF